MTDAEEIDAELIEAKLRELWVLEPDYAPLYKKWKGTQEFKWFYEKWLPDPVFPLPLSRAGQTRALAIMRDFGFKYSLLERLQKIRTEDLPRDKIAVVYRRLQELVRGASPGPKEEKEKEKEEKEERPAPTNLKMAVDRAEEQYTAETTEMLRKLNDDLRALTAERDELRKQLEAANAALRQCAVEQQRVKEEIVESGSDVAPPPPPPPPAPAPPKTVVSVPRRALLDEIEKGTTLKKAQTALKDAEKKPLGKAEERDFMADIAKAMMGRRGKMVGTEVIGEPVLCDMCYSPAQIQCRQCKGAVYCDPDCQKAHWRHGHSKTCEPK